MKAKKPISITHTELHDLVWRQPRSRLAQAQRVGDIPAHAGEPYLERIMQPFENPAQFGADRRFSRVLHTGVLMNRRLVRATAPPCGSCHRIGLPPKPWPLRHGPLPTECRYLSQFAVHQLEVETGVDRLGPQVLVCQFTLKRRHIHFHRSVVRSIA